MAEYRTVEGRRPDLEAMEVAPPEGFIGAQLMPTFETADRTGTVYYQGTSGAAIAESTAETSRGASTAPAEQAIAASTTTWTCAEVIDRTYITPSEAKSMGGMEKADQIGAKVAKRNVMNAIENAIRAKVLGDPTPSATFDASKFLLQVQTGLESMRLYEGEKILYGSTIAIKGVIRSMLTDSQMGPVFSRIISGTAPTVALGGMNLKILTEALSVFLGVDRVVAGRDSNWNVAATPGRVGLMTADNSGDPLSHKWKAIYGKNFLYLPDGKQPFTIETFYDNDDLTNKYTCYASYGLVEMNSACLYVFDGVTVS